MSSEENALYNEITLIIGIINRVSNLAFVIKGWAMTLIGIILSFTSPSCIKAIILILLIWLFWFLDAKYYQIERFYRYWYDIVISGDRKGLPVYTLNPSTIKEILGYKDISIIKCLLNKTIMPIYLILLIINVFIMIK